MNSGQSKEVQDYHDFGLWFIVIFGVMTIPILLFIAAPYGRHMRNGWGPDMSAKLGWVIMEAPSPLGFAYVWFTYGGLDASLAAWCLFALWQVHYIYRSFIYPFRLRGTGKRSAVLTVVMAIGFNLVNGPINAYALVALAPHLTDAWLSDPRFWIGLIVFCAGFGINHQSDAILRNLRKPGESGYKIPQGGLYRFVTSPNYLGEIIEWMGYAIAACTPAAAAFAFFTAANLMPRARSHHAWYLEKFPDYPKERRAIIPGLL